MGACVSANVQSVRMAAHVKRGADAHRGVCSLKRQDSSETTSSESTASFSQASQVADGARRGISSIESTNARARHQKPALYASQSADVLSSTPVPCRTPCPSPRTRTLSNEEFSRVNDDGGDNHVETMVSGRYVQEIPFPRRDPPPSPASSTVSERKGAPAETTTQKQASDQDKESRQGRLTSLSTRSVPLRLNKARADSLPIRLHHDESSKTTSAAAAAAQEDIDEFRERLALMRRFYSWKEIPLDFFVDSHVTIEGSASCSRRRKATRRASSHRHRSSRKTHQQETSVGSSACQSKTHHHVEASPRGACPSPKQHNCVAQPA